MLRAVDAAAWKLLAPSNTEEQGVLPLVLKMEWLSFGYTGSEWREENMGITAWGLGLREVL